MKRQTISKLIALSALLFIYSCSGKRKNADDGYFFQDFDNLKMWAPNERITSEKSYSGSYSTYTDVNHEYSQAFDMEFNYAKSKGYKIMQVSAWCYITDEDTKANLVAAVEIPDKSIVTEAVDLASTINVVNKWSKIKLILKIPADAPQGAKIKVYLWCPQKQKIFLDDVEIQFSN